MEEFKMRSPLVVYQDFCRKGKLAYQYSPEDGTAIFYPRVVSPTSASENIEWRISEGKGVVYATTTIYPRDDKPYNVAIIELDEGYRMMGRVEDIAPDEVKIGLRVWVRMHNDEKGQIYPVFAPTESKA